MGQKHKNYTLLATKTFENNYAKCICKITDQTIAVGEYKVIWLISYSSFNISSQLWGHKDWVTSLLLVELPLKERELISASEDKTIRRWDIKTESCIQIIDTNNRYQRTFFLPRNVDNTATPLLISSGNTSFTIRKLNPKTNEYYISNVTKTSNTGIIYSIICICSPEWIILTGCFSAIQSWVYYDDTCELCTTVHMDDRSPIYSIMETDKKQIVACTVEGVFVFKDSRSFEIDFIFKDIEMRYALGIVNLSKSRDIFILTMEGDLLLWDMALRICKNVIDVHLFEATGVIQIEENILISVSRDSTMKKWRFKRK